MTRRGCILGASHRSMIMFWACGIVGGFSMITFLGGGATLGAKILMILRPIGVGIFGGASRIMHASGFCTTGVRVRITIGGAGGGTIGAFKSQNKFLFKNNIREKIHIVKANLLLNDDVTWWRKWWWLQITNSDLLVGMMRCFAFLWQNKRVGIVIDGVLAKRNGAAEVLNLTLVDENTSVAVHGHDFLAVFESGSQIIIIIHA